MVLTKNGKLHKRSWRHVVTAKCLPDFKSITPINHLHKQTNSVKFTYTFNTHFNP
jgi:hypothetical protein